MRNNGVNPLQVIQQAIMNGGANPQAYAEQILRNNPQFAQMIQGQNPQKLLDEQLGRMGIDPRQITKMFGRR